MTDAEINELTLKALGIWPTFQAQSWACKVVHAVLEAQQFQPDLTTIPDGWWLYGLFHNHTPIRFKDERHTPMTLDTHGRDPWEAKLQRVEGGMLTAGHGLTPRAALRDAIMQVELRDMPEEER